MTFTTFETEFLDSIRTIAGDVAAAHAADVDKNARFPQESIDALREERALSSLVPTELGGGGASIEAVAEACFELGRRCAATGMVFAMHQIQVGCIVRHYDDSAWFANYLESLCDEQRLIASATSEVGTGGDLSKSVATVTPGENGLSSFEKQAPTVSYGAHADDLLTTVRRSPDSDPGDQVAVLTRREQMTMEPTSVWDTLGMRGTCSPGFKIAAEFPTEQILPQGFARISALSMVPLSHVFWAYVWLGIATDAFDRAHAFVRGGARKNPGVVTPQATRLSSLLSELALLRAAVRQGLSDYVNADEDELETAQYALRINTLKIAASEQAPRICQGALAICGIVGFANTTPFSVGRHVRDSMSGSLMIAHERIHATNASLLAIAKDV